MGGDADADAETGGEIECKRPGEKRPVKPVT
jgi:hypothetical protein